MCPLTHNTRLGFLRLHAKDATNDCVSRDRTARFRIYLTVLLHKVFFLYEAYTAQNQAVGMASAIDCVGGKVYITTERLLLRPAKEEDAEALHEIFHDPTVMLYWYGFSIEKDKSCLFV